MDFLPAPSVMVAFTLACVLLALTPGPDMTYFLSRTLAGGRKMGIMAMLGATTGLMGHAMLAGFGLSALIAASTRAFMFIKVAGAGYLLFLAVQAIRHGSALSIARTEGTGPGAFATWLTGIGVNLTNPKVILFYVTFLPQFVDVHDPAASHKLLFMALYFLFVGTLINGIVILVASRFILMMRENPKAMRIFDYGFAALMSGFALRIITVQGQ